MRQIFSPIIVRLKPARQVNSIEQSQDTVGYCVSRPCPISANVVRLLCGLVLASYVLVVLDSPLTAAPPESTHLYFFTSDGCAPCEVVKPSIQKLTSAGFPTSTINVRSKPEWARHFQIARTPTVVLVHQNRAVGRREGMISHQELLRWFETIGYRPNSTEALNSAPVSTVSVAAVPKPSTRPPTSSGSANRSAANIQSATAPNGPIGTKVVLDNPRASIQRSDNFNSSTLHHGTRTPANSAEARALAATVKIQVEDPAGISYATGTVIHSHENESLVMTCGHVFRDSNGTGKIRAQYGFDQPTQSMGDGKLVFYDADARDIALIVINTTGAPLTPVEVASRKFNVTKGDDVFSIGCDHGEPPTIRRTRIKNRASYDGAIKYDIFGRPVDGRSGGGLFTSDGRIIGVCNAAVVDVDEGIYTALDTIHWQLAKVKLDHLFDPDTALAMSARSIDSHDGPDFDTRSTPRSTLGIDRASPETPSPPTRRPLSPNQIPVPVLPSQQLELPPSPSAPATHTLASSSGIGGSGRRNPLPKGSSQTLVSLGNQSGSQEGSRLADYEREVLIIVRSKDDSAPAKTITIDNPSHKLVNYLNKLTPPKRSKREFEMARFREQAQSGVQRPFQDRTR